MAPSFFFPNTWPLVGGDFNCYDSVFDKFGGAPSLDSVFKGYKSGCRLGDAWRLKHPLEKQFTWFNADLTIVSLHSLTSCRIALQRLFFSLNIFVDLSWLQSDLIGPFYATILLLVLRDRWSFTLVYFRNCAPLISLLLSPLRQKHFTPCFCSGLFLCQSCRTTGLLMFLRVFLFSRIGNRCVILLLKTLRMILHG